ncbi:MmpS family transport accessory protein [Pseudonocardia sp. NPDC046786]|uniref:MmpS family transport accessory protein n=1 Tax=Pseudonocardia sp. NPDC046786 TaxID=3155471 RepID=UPI0033DAB02C
MPGPRWDPDEGRWLLDDERAPAPRHGRRRSAEVIDPPDDGAGPPAGHRSPDELAAGVVFAPGRGAAAGPAPLRDRRPEPAGEASAPPKLITERHGSGPMDEARDDDGPRRGRRRAPEPSDATPPHPRLPHRPGTRGRRAADVVPPGDDRPVGAHRGGRRRAEDPTPPTAEVPVRGRHGGTAAGRGYEPAEHGYGPAERDDDLTGRGSGRAGSDDRWAEPGYDPAGPAGFGGLGGGPAHAGPAGPASGAPGHPDRDPGDPVRPPSGYGAPAHRRDAYDPWYDPGPATDSTDAADLAEPADAVDTRVHASVRARTAASDGTGGEPPTRGTRRRPARDGGDDDAPAGRRRWPWLAAAAAVAAAVPIGVAVLGGSDDEPRTAPTEEAVASGTPSGQEAGGGEPGGEDPGIEPAVDAVTEPAATEVIFEVNGSGSAGTITVGRGTAVSQVSGAELPWERTLPAESGPTDYSVSAAGGSGEISCRILVDGAVISEESADGDFSAVSCSGNR